MAVDVMKEVEGVVVGINRGGNKQTCQMIYTDRVMGRSMIMVLGLGLAKGEEISGGQFYT
eukprot:3553794-Ditylum_brightwellii.AAC.1